MPLLGVAEPRIDFLETVDSTNAEALRRLRAGERGPLWIVSRRQTAGRGRRGRQWISPPGNLQASLLLSDPAPPAAAPQIAFVAGLALHDAANCAAPVLAASLTLKWPNDVLCSGRKVAGILIEGEGNPVAVAIGFGVNCRDHPPDTEYPATDFAANGAEVEASALIRQLAAAMGKRLVQWDRGVGFAAIRAAWLDRADGLGRHLVARLGERETRGIFVTVDDLGHLLLRRDDGTVEAIAAGTVFPLASGDDRHVQR